MVNRQLYFFQRYFGYQMRLSSCLFQLLLCWSSVFPLARVKPLVLFNDQVNVCSITSSAGSNVRVPNYLKMLVNILTKTMYILP